jgi:hypothetical protein
MFYHLGVYPDLDLLSMDLFSHLLTLIYLHLSILPFSEYLLTLICSLICLQLSFYTYLFSHLVNICLH